MGQAKDSIHIQIMDVTDVGARRCQIANDQERDAQHHIAFTRKAIRIFDKTHARVQSKLPGKS